MYYEERVIVFVVKLTARDINIIFYQCYAVIARIGESITLMNEAQDINHLMLLEARNREIYYSCYNSIIKHADFQFTKRSRRPPLDPLNSMISFGNALLYRLIAKEIYKSQLDIRISFLHSSLWRNENLNLDLAEIFKPIIIDRLIFTLINKRMIDATMHLTDCTTALFC